MQFFQAVDKLNKTTAKSLMEKDNRNNDDVMKLISEHRQTQLELYKLYNQLYQMTQSHII